MTSGTRLTEPAATTSPTPGAAPASGEPLIRCRGLLTTVNAVLVTSDALVAGDSIATTTTPMYCSGNMSFTLGAWSS